MSSMEQIQKNIRKLEDFERMRKEQHDNERIIFNRECSLEQMFQNLMRHVSVTYKNRVIEERKKIPSLIKGIRRKNLIFYVFLLLAVLVCVCFFCIDWLSMENGGVKTLLMLSLFAAPLLLLIVGGCFKCSGRKYMAEYIEVWNIVKPPVEIVRLSNGQLAVISYAARDKGSMKHTSALNEDDTLQRQYFSTPVNSVYIIDKISSCSRTANGLMIESAGRYYGIRAAYWHRNINSSAHIHSCSYVFAEAHISYRKEEIPTIFTDWDSLEASLSGYQDYEAAGDMFDPLQ